MTYIGKKSVQNIKKHHKFTLQIMFNVIILKVIVLRKVYLHNKHSHNLIDLL